MAAGRIRHSRRMEHGWLSDRVEPGYWRDTRQQLAGSVQADQFYRLSRIAMRKVTAAGLLCRPSCKAACRGRPPADTSNCIVAPVSQSDISASRPSASAAVGLLGFRPAHAREIASQVYSQGEQKHA